MHFSVNQHSPSSCLPVVYYAPPGEAIVMLVMKIIEDAPSSYAHLIYVSIFILVGTTPIIIGQMKRHLPKLAKYICSLFGLILFSLANPLWAASDQSQKTNIPDNSSEQSGINGEPEASEEVYVWDPNRRDWENGYYKDMYSRYQPLNGHPPDQLGNGGGWPSIYFKVKQTDNNNIGQTK